MRYRWGNCSVRTCLRLMDINTSFKNKELTSTKCSEKFMILDSRNGLWKTSPYRNSREVIVNKSEEYSEERNTPLPGSVFIECAAQMNFLAN